MGGLWLPLPDAAIDMDFTTGNYFGGTEASLLSISRASSGTAENASGGIETFPANTLRRTNKGVLIEEARTNLYIQSENLAVSHTLSGSSVTADTVTGAASSESVRNASAITVVAATTYSASLDLEYINTPWIMVRLATDAAATHAINFWVNCQTGAIGASSTTSGTDVVFSLSSVKVELKINGRCRVSFQFSLSTLTTVFLSTFGMAGDGSTLRNNLGSGAGVGTQYKRTRMQLELGAFATSYIPTTTVAVTRNLDNISIIGAALTALQGTAVTVVDEIVFGSMGVTTAYANLNDGTLRRLLRKDAANTITTTWNATSAALVTANAALATTNKVAIAVSGAGRSLCLNGGTVATDVNAPSIPTSASLGESGAVYLRRRTIYPTRKSNAELQALTA